VTTNSPALDDLLDHRQRFLRFLERRVGSSEDAEEILQQALTRAWERADSLTDDSRVVAWFYRILRNAVVDWWRARASEARLSDALAIEFGDAHEPPPEAHAELCRCFEPLLDQINPGYAELLRRVDLGEERPVDVAAELGLTANNTMVRLHRARAALRERLIRTCRHCAAHGCLDCSCSPPGTS
jgi:RNA polymerase sigma-70 factor (ECF subfamily)